MAEPVAPLLADIVKKGGYTHLVAAHTALGKNVFPRVAGLLDVAQVLSLKHLSGVPMFEVDLRTGFGCDER